MCNLPELAAVEADEDSAPGLVGRYRDKRMVAVVGIAIRVAIFRFAAIPR